MFGSLPEKLRHLSFYQKVDWNVMCYSKTTILFSVPGMRLTRKTPILLRLVMTPRQCEFNPHECGIVIKHTEKKVGAFSYSFSLKCNIIRKKLDKSKLLHLSCHAEYHNFVLSIDGSTINLLASLLSNTWDNSHK